MQSDPIGYGDGANLYAYVAADPINVIDPLGLAGFYICIADFTWVAGNGNGLEGEFVNIPNCTYHPGSGSDYGSIDWGGMGPGSMYDHFPGAGLSGPPSQSDPQYAPFQSAYQRASEENRWMIIPVAAAVAAPIVVEAGIFAWAGREISFGRNFRIALFGNRTGNVYGRWPHYHRRSIGSNGQTRPGQGIGRHRPWQTKPTDKNFGDRF